MKNILIKVIAPILAGIILLGIGYFIGEKIGFNKGYENGWKKGYDDGIETQKAATELGAGAAVGNPFNSIPTANPFEDSINPFK